MISLYRCCNINTMDFNSHEYLFPIHVIPLNKTYSHSPKDDSLEEGLSEAISHKILLYPPLKKTHMRANNTLNHSSHKSALYRKISSHSNETLITSEINSDQLTKKVGKIAEVLKKISRTRSPKGPSQYKTLVVPSPQSKFKFFTTYYRCPGISKSTKHLVR